MRFLKIIAVLAVLLALVGCAVTTGFGAVVNDARLKAGQSLAVIGVGGVGINAIQAAALAGAVGLSVKKPPRVVFSPETGLRFPVVSQAGS